MSKALSKHSKPCQQLTGPQLADEVEQAPALDLEA